MKKVNLSRKVALQGQKFMKKVNLGRKVALRGQKFIKKVNLGRKVALWGQKFIKKVNMGRKVDLGRKIQLFNIVLKRVLTLPKARSRKMFQFPLKNMGLQYKNISVVTKH